MMGIYLGLSRADSTTFGAKNPNPRNFKILRQEVVGGVRVIMAAYPDATNYEGQKIMILSGTAPVDSTFLDPHFMEGGRVKARFEPTEEGWQLALRVAALQTQP
jgi:hypothetical protein